MSTKALDWAFGLDLPSATKFVLVALADYASVTGEAWPCTETLAKKTSMDRKAVIANIDRLESMGLLVDTGKREGRTHQIKVYRLEGAESKAPKNGTLSDPKAPKSGTVPFTPSKAPTFGAKDSLIRETEPLIEPREPSVPPPTPPKEGSGERIFSLQNSISRSFNRVEGQRWSEEEERLLAGLMKRPEVFDEWPLVRCFKDCVPKERRRFEGVTTVKQMLEHWAEILDKVNTDYDASGTGAKETSEKGSPKRKLSMYELKEKHEALLEQARQFKFANSVETAMGVEWSMPEWRDQYRELKRQAREVSDQIATFEA